MTNSFIFLLKKNLAATTVYFRLDVVIVEIYGNSRFV